MVISIGKISNSWIKYLNSISAYTKSWLVSWSDDRDLSLRVDVIG